MDATGNPAKKRPTTTTRATPRQVEILQIAFEQSTATSKGLLKKLSEETGLSPKWIVAWYSRQRKKRKGYGDTSSDPMMSPEEIANFKTESRESMLATSTDIGILNAKKRELGLPPTKRRRGRPPNRKVKTEQHDGENSFVSNQPCPLAPLLLATDPRPPVSENNLCSSRFMRPIAPRMYLSPSFQLCQPSVPLPTAPNLHDSSNPFVITGPLNNDYIPAAHDKTQSQNHLQNSIRSPLHQALHASTQDENSPFCRAQRPIIRRVPYPSRIDEWPTPVTPMNNSTVTKTTHLAEHPLFTHNILSFSRSMADPHRDAASVDQLPTLGIDPSLSPLDPSKAPLKHLSVLQPFVPEHNDDTSTAFDHADLMIDRLLDKRLAEDDPFQATMGLVFLSQLGLEWDYE